MVMLLRHLSLLALLSLAAMPSAAADNRSRFVARTVEIDGTSMPYQVFVPTAATSTAGPLPVVLFLHGSGERGRDGDLQTRAGLGPWLRAHGDDFPALVVLPQVPEDEEWDEHNARLALATLDAAIDEFGGDHSRQYLTGMSMGGYGTWNTALIVPARFAALVPVCGGVLAPRAERPTLRVEAVADATDPHAALALRLKDVPVWMFHGARDELVPPDDDRKLLAAFHAAGARDVRYTEYPEGGHNAWDATYADPAMWQWLLQQKR